MLATDDVKQTFRRLHVDEAAHPVWSRAFQDRVRLEQVSDDLLAGRSVAIVLVAIVTTGLLLGALGVLLCI